VNAWFSYAGGKINAATSFLKQCSELVKEKNAWTYGYSLLESMLLIEKRSYEAAIYKLDALRKSIVRSKTDSNVKRALLCATILKQIIRTDNDYSEAAKIASKEITQLSSPASGAIWDPTGFEIIPFEKMVRLRANGVKQKI
jgi:hypothetical protein